MEDYNIPRNEITYSALAWAVEKNGDGKTALHVIELMKNEGLELNIVIYNAAMWACVKGGLWEQALQLYEEVSSKDIECTIETYNAAIWACEQGLLWERAVEILRLIKLKGLSRQTMSYDGVLSVLQQVGQWKLACDILKWMELENVDKDTTTYTAVITALDEAQQEDIIAELYQQAMRDGIYIPWIPKTRIIDFRKFPFPVAKAALKSILKSMKDGKLNVFSLTMILSDLAVPHDAAAATNEHHVVNHAISGTSTSTTELITPMTQSTDSVQLEELLQRRNKKMTGINTEFMSNFIVNEIYPIGFLEVNVVEEDGTLRLVIPRDSLMKWTLGHVDKTVAVKI